MLYLLRCIFFYKLVLKALVFVVSGYQALNALYEIRNRKPKFLLNGAHALKFAITVRCKCAARVTAVSNVDSSFSFSLRSRFLFFCLCVIVFVFVFLFFFYEKDRGLWKRDFPFHSPRVNLHLYFAISPWRKNCYVTTWIIFLAKSEVNIGRRGF